MPIPHASTGFTTRPSQGEGDGAVWPTAATPRARAEEAIVRIEGSLVLARVIGDSSNFERILKALPDLLSAA